MPTQQRKKPLIKYKMSIFESEMYAYPRSKEDRDLAIIYKPNWIIIVGIKR